MRIYTDRVEEINKWVEDNCQGYHVDIAGNSIAVILTLDDDLLFHMTFAHQFQINEQTKNWFTRSASAIDCMLALDSLRNGFMVDDFNIKTVSKSEWQELWRDWFNVP